MAPQWLQRATVAQQCELASREVSWELEGHCHGVSNIFKICFRIYLLCICMCVYVGQCCVHVRKSEGNWRDSVLFLPRESRKLNYNHGLGDRRPTCWAISLAQGIMVYSNNRRWINKLAKLSYKRSERKHSGLFRSHHFYPDSSGVRPQRPSSRAHKWLCANKVLSRWTGSKLQATVWRLLIHSDIKQQLPDISWTRVLWWTDKISTTQWLSSNNNFA